VAAWHHVRDKAILGPWCARRELHRFGDELDLESIHRRTLDILKAPGDMALLNELLTTGT
jgi:hypothetical protein